MGSDGFLCTMEDRPCLQVGLAHAERLFHMPELAVVCDNLDAGQFFFCDVGDIAFDAEKFLCLCLKIGIEDEGLDEPS